ncbi:hypothetical protein C1878_13810 [Gordonibacter sp. 28C]|uniref:hypothetical protein n=1 Tax=Gordonibacter sp. 28C TaxID=2078569 RepID=UPI000DF7D836|nr:hypothetical protein [Gordonibacter sp. 28C]RDB60525.1 hypothetical protein C1878_13810 [Gordonibacter sp. 28C]
MLTRKYTVWFNAFFCILMSAVFCYCMPLMQGAPTVPMLGSHGFLVSFLISLVVSLLVANVVPIGRIGASAAAKFDAKPGTFVFSFVTAMFIGLIMMTALAFTMIAYNTGLGIVEGTTIFDRLVSGLVSFGPLVFAVVFFLYPLCTGLAGLVVKPEDKFVRMPDSAAAPAR